MDHDDKRGTFAVNYHLFHTKVNYIRRKRNLKLVATGEASQHFIEQVVHIPRRRVPIGRVQTSPHDTRINGTNTLIFITESGILTHRQRESNGD